MMNSTYSIRRIAAEYVCAAIADLFPGSQPVRSAITDFGFFVDILADQPLDEHAFPMIEEKMRAKLKKGDFPVFLEMMRENAAHFLDYHRQTLGAEFVRSEHKNIIQLLQIGEWIHQVDYPFTIPDPLPEVIRLVSIEEIQREVRGLDVVSVKRIHGIASQNKAEAKQMMKIYTQARRYAFNPKGMFAVIPEIVPGSAIWLPKGEVIKNNLMSRWKSLLREQGYQIVSTPPYVSKQLMKRAALIHSEGEVWVQGGPCQILPSLAPSHAALFATSRRKSEDLPIRYAECNNLIFPDYGEFLRGLEPGKLVVADFAHTFCDWEHLHRELISSLQFIERIVKMLGFRWRWSHVYSLAKKSVAARLWDKAQQMLQGALNELGIACEEIEEPYCPSGPLVRAVIVDSFGREWKGPYLGIDLVLPKKAWFVF